MFSGCSTEQQLVEAAARGEVKAQYDLAIYYSQLEKPQKNKAFDWMKQAAICRYRPAMRKLARYYLTGYGTEVNYQNASKWIRRYLETYRSSEEALRIAQEILMGASSRQDLIAGFALYQMAVMYETQAARSTSEIARTAAKEIMLHACKAFNWMLNARNYVDAGKLLEFTEKCYREYGESFPAETAEQLNKMRRSFDSSFEN
ncbi:MAG: sel1 repeat family protein [Lentisphaeria bacterium]|nr:sel1 repeat family protein [Lentisphaeria bacterium]